MRDALTRAIAGEEPRPRAPEAFVIKASLPPIKSEVSVSNDAASEHSVVDVIAGDRPKLLHDIARFFHEEALSVDLAFIATEGRVARDSFYVVDATGKILSDAHAAEVALKLRTTLDSAAV